MGTGKLITYQISGNSMSPLLKDGQKIGVQKCNRYVVGDVVVCPHPIQTDLTIVKQIVAIDSNLNVQLRGINASESSHRFGKVHMSKIIGKMVSILD